MLHIVNTAEDAPVGTYVVLTYLSDHFHGRVKRHLSHQGEIRFDIEPTPGRCTRPIAGAVIKPGFLVVDPSPFEPCGGCQRRRQREARTH
ncbi:hypothetical protein CIB93_09125 [Streptomyces sp. WZ.A104]|uniref:hypothetical protein n=1 Tax=Streptomyces sp. WZ.A104 TaxID=2023771 RepID=UPI000BBC3C23|nr:hypothetical protein [Streptomyces sp. WZ.A104]PCG86383.1 hypothetical protein CIB93_09125 [Streptomyces sp. WZ.A104]